MATHELGNDQDALGFDQVASTLTSWLGRWVSVLVGPTGEPYGGRTWARFAGALAAGGPRCRVASGHSAPTEVVGLSVGGADLVFHRDMFADGFWVSREHGFFVCNNGDAQIGIALQRLSGRDA